MMYETRDIVLVSFPFFDKNASKRRPAVILSHDEHYGKYVCAAITSQANRNLRNRYECKLKDTLSVGLIYADQWVLPDKISTIEDRLIIKKLGTMSEYDFHQVASMVYEIFFSPYKSLHTTEYCRFVLKLRGNI